MAAALTVPPLLFALIGCDRRSEVPSVSTAKPRSIRSTPLADNGTSGATRFERLDASTTGITVVNRYPPGAVRHVAGPFAGGGACIGDYDGDGRPDVYLTNQAAGNRLYRNLGGWRFEDTTQRAGVDGGGAWCTGATFVDVDDDGDLDLFVCTFDAPSRLYVNQGDGTFTDEAGAWGLDFQGAGIMAAFGDYDRDGDLDAYLLTNRHRSGHTAVMPSTVEESNARGITYRDDRGYPQVTSRFENLFTFIDKPGGFRPLHLAGQADRLYRNDTTSGSPRFTDVTDDAGISGRHLGLAATWWDYDHDGWPDLYVSNDFYGPDQLYRNNADGTFTDVTGKALPHTPWFSMGADQADINNDGLVDFMASDMAATTHRGAKLSMGDMDRSRWFLESARPRQYMRNAVYLNAGTGRLMEAAFLTGLASSDWTWSVKLADLDNDGWTDVFITNGMTRDWFNSDLQRQRDRAMHRGENAWETVWQPSPVLSQANRAYRNRGDLSFEDVGAQWGLDHVGVSFGAALGDLDRDGDLDLVAHHFDEAAGIYRNDGRGGHRVLVRLAGTVSNRFGIGATVKIETSTGLQVRRLTLASGFMSANEPIVHFGMGQQARIERLTIDWPSGHRQTFEDLEADRIYTITEPHGAAPSDDPEPSEVPRFARTSRLPSVKHREQPFDDYARQPLLPQKLSRLGPGMAWGDVDDDGDDDVYVGGAAGQTGSLYLNGSAGFTRGAMAPFLADKASEDMAPLLFDADGDGDQDLYVVSGGVECEPGDVVLRDRLYLNDGRGGFTKSDGMLPDLRDSGSAVAAADFDRDGDLDLFVGGRVVPGRYPVTPSSRILRNKGGGSGFHDMTDEVAPGLRETGLVTAAIWSDADDDGWIDLLVTHEWGPVRFYRNVEGRMVDATAAAGLADRHGWWNGIAARDIDDDGDIDYAVTNQGLNSKYGQPDAAHPASLYYGDMSGSGQLRLVEAGVKHGELLPVRGRSCSAGAMPFVAEKFPTFEAFASATLSDIYTPQCLAQATELTATELASGILRNDGRGRFSFEPLPRIAQISPGFGVALTDVDGDGATDLYFVQNYFSREPETGHLDGGVGLLMTGTGDGTFAPVWPNRSGLVVPGDAKGLGAVNLDGDGWIDFVITTNDGPTAAFQNRGEDGNRMLRVRLQGPAGNPTAIGARVTVHRTDDRALTAEVSAGGSYLSQSSPTLFFGLGRTSARRIEVRWPRGDSTSVEPSPDEVIVELTRPD